MRKRSSIDMQMNDFYLKDKEGKKAKNDDSNNRRVI